ncbi:hypothetical protein [Luteibacter yeojuensis]
MELDDLKEGWKELDRRLAYMEARLTTARATAGVRRELRPLVAGQVLQAVLGVVLAIGAGSFWFDHRGNPNLVVTGLFLHLYAISMIVAAARNLFLVQRVDEGAPVLVLQHRLASLRAWRIREGRWFGAVGCFAWVGLVVWAFGLLGVDIVAARPLFVGFLLLTASICLAVFAVMARLDKAPEGSATRRAAERLAEIRRFESTDEAP